MSSVIPLEEVVTVTTRDQKQVPDRQTAQNGPSHQNGASSRYVTRVTRSSAIQIEPHFIPQETSQTVSQDQQVARTRSGTRSHHPQTNSAIAPTSADGIAFKQSNLDAKYPNPYEQKHKEWRSLLAPPAPAPSANPYPTRTSSRKAPPPAVPARPPATVLQQEQPQPSDLKHNGTTAIIPETCSAGPGLLTRSKLKQQVGVTTPKEPEQPPRIRILPGDKFYPLKIKMEVPLPRPSSSKTVAPRKESIKSASDEDPGVEENSDSEFEAEDVEDEDY